MRHQWFFLLFCLCFLCSATYAVEWVRDITPLLQKPDSMIAGQRLDHIENQIHSPNTGRRYVIRSQNGSFVYAVLDETQMRFFSLPQCVQLTSDSSNALQRSIILYKLFTENPLDPTRSRSPMTLNQSLMEQMEQIHQIMDLFGELVPNHMPEQLSQIQSIASGFTQLAQRNAYRIDPQETFPNDHSLSLLIDTVKKCLQNAKTSIDILSIPLLYEAVRDIHITHWHRTFPIWVNPETLIPLMEQGLSTPPYSSAFDRWFDPRARKESLKWQSHQLAINLYFQQSLSKVIDQTLKQITLNISKTMGELDVALAETLLTQILMFHVLTLDNVQMILEAGTDSARKKLSSIYLIPEWDDFSQFLLWYHDLWDWIHSVGFVLSYEGMQNEQRWLFSQIGKPDLTEQTELEPILVEGKRSPIVFSVEIPDQKVHFIQLKLEVRYSQWFSQYSDTFTRFFPVYAPYGSEGTQVILPDFFWFIANHPGASILMVLESMLFERSGVLSFNLDFMEFSAKSGKAITLNPYMSLWRMEIPEFVLQIVETLQNPYMNYLERVFFPDDLPYLQRLFASRSILDRLIISRRPTQLFMVDCPSEDSLPSIAKNAVILIHGKQQTYGLDPDGTPIGNDFPVWLNRDRYNTWSEWYPLFLETLQPIYDYDFYEFIHDSSVISTKEYGEGLAKILETHHFFEKYQKIYLIAHSQGGLIARHAANSPVFVGGTERLAGSFFDRIFTLNTPHLGTVLQSFSCIVNPLLDQWLHQPNGHPAELDASLWGLIWMALEGNISQSAVEASISMAGLKPMYVGKLFSEIVGMLDPFPGGKSMEYSDLEFIHAAAKTLYPDLSDEMVSLIFPFNEELDQLNHSDAFLGKLVLIGSHVSHLDGLETVMFQTPYAFMRYVAQETSRSQNTDYTPHGISDGVVPFLSQMMEGIDSGQKRLFFPELDHSQITSNHKVIREIIRFIMAED